MHCIRMYNEATSYYEKALSLSTSVSTYAGLSYTYHLQDDFTKAATYYHKPRRAGLDMNQHVNNVIYIGWVLELPEEEEIIRLRGSNQRLNSWRGVSPQYPRMIKTLIT